jgi:DNA-binding beta-propeller fold protein YncE
VADRSDNGGNGNILAYAINFSTGALNAVGGSPFTAGVDNPSAVTVDPSGRYLFLTNVPGDASVDGYISIYTINPTLGLQGSAGALSEISSSPVATGIFPYSVQVDPLGSFVYVTSASIFTSDNVYGYALDAASGALTNLEFSPFSSGEAGAPNGMAVDPSGRFAYVADNVFDNVTAFTIGATDGILNIIPGDSAVPAGTNPTSVAITGTIN